MNDQGTERAYREQYDLFMVAPEEDLVHCNVPLEIETAEATQLAIVALEDRQALLNAGIRPELVDSLPARAGAFTFAAAQYEIVINADPEASKLWKEYSPLGHELQKDLTRTYKFAFRRNNDLTKSVVKIKEGRGNKDMILDLLSLNILGTQNLAQFENMKMFDTAKIEEAKTLHDKLSDLYARSTIDPKEVNEAKDILDHAYTYYKQAADEVKDHGKFVFEGTDRLQAYISDYRQNVGKMSDKPKIF